MKPVGTQDCSRLRPGQFIVLAVQLGLLSIVLRQFQIESAAFLRLALLAFAGFAVHAFLPLRHRLPFFFLLSVTGIVMVFGSVQAAWLIGIGFVLIGICHLPVRLAGRIGLLLGVGALLAMLRAGWLGAPWSGAVWPILASIFMFRIMVYLYDLQHDTEPVSVWRTLSYFFLLPNVCFPLFPVVDYKTFRRSYYDQAAFETYQIGVGWMMRGVVHLIVYRFVYYYVTLSPTDVTNAATLAQYVVANFLLYLRVSGQFHIIVGMLYLFGFRLPETHHLYYFASSFTDFWRRINIYWKDFMLKLVYYPTYFRLRAWGATTALVLSTTIVFAATWLLHAYQWFWLRGSFLLTWPDVTFWSILALLVIVNSLWETKRGRTRTLKKPAWTWRRMGSVTLRTAGTFAAIAMLWSLWTAESLRAWLSLWRVLPGGLTFDWPSLTPALFVAGIAVIGARGGPLGGAAAGVFGRLWGARRYTVVNVAALVGLALVGVPVVYTQFGATAATVINSLRTGRLNRVDTALLERGYYEDLIRVERFNSELWQVYMSKPVEWLDVQGTGLERFTGDFLQKDLLPSAASTTRFGPVRTNRWGMRDRDYDRQPKPGTYRIAMLGASTVMGWGVRDDETFEALVEERLNRERSASSHGRYEILNFAVPGYQPLQQRVMVQRAFEFSPDAVVYVATGREASRAADYLAEVVRKRVPIPYDYLAQTARAAGVEPTTEATEALRRLKPVQGEILSWLYGEIVRECRERGIVPVLVFVPQVDAGAWREETPDMLRRAEAAGFVVIDLDDVYRQHDVKQIRLAEWDNHPNVAGHRLIADRLYDALLARKDAVFVRRTVDAVGR